jgi:hypothetical protein
MKEQTALMELIEMLNKNIKEVTQDNEFGQGFIYGYECAIHMAEDLLQVEQEQIWDAHLAGENHECDMEEGEIRDSRECGHYKYYQDTYPTDWEEDAKQRRKDLLMGMMRGDEAKDL